MVKQKTLLSELKALKPSNRAKTFSQTLSPSQLKKYREALTLINSLDIADRPKHSEIRELLKKHLGKSPGNTTFSKDLRSLNESPKRSK